MALAFCHLSFLLSLKHQKLDEHARVNSMLELGEQNWYGDVNPAEMSSMIDQFYAGDKAEKLKQELAVLLSKDRRQVSFELAKLFYKVIFDYEAYAAIDMHGTDISQKIDLNAQIKVDKQYDLVTNFGTAEHVFNQYQFFKNMHDLTKPGGLMLHSFPNQGCYDHGFYNYHPTFCFDLCDANSYMTLSVVYADQSVTPAKMSNISRESYVVMAVEKKLSNYSGLIALFRKRDIETEFRIPQQAYYDDRLPAQLAEAWRKLER